MSQPHATVAVIVMSLIAVSLSCFAGSQNLFKIQVHERSVEELKLMTIPELAGEARYACRLILDGIKSSEKFRALEAFNYAWESIEQINRAEQYLARVGLVIRDKQGGKMPAWFDQFSSPARKTPEDCDAAATAGGWRPKP
jgi:hypothetical protein